MVVVVGKHPLVSRLLKGIYNRKPPQPRYSTTWDVAAVLDHIRSWGPTESLCRKNATLKLAMLMALANASRCSELHALDVQRMRWSKEGVILFTGGSHQDVQAGEKQGVVLSIT